VTPDLMCCLLLSHEFVLRSLSSFATNSHGLLALVKLRTTGALTLSRLARRGKALVCLQQALKKSGLFGESSRCFLLAGSHIGATAGTQLHTR